MKTQKFIKKLMQLFIKLMVLLIVALLIFQVTSLANQDGAILDIDNSNDDILNNAKKTEIITSFDWIQDVDPSIGSITIEDEGKKVNMTGNERLPGKNAIYIIPENHQEQNLTFDYNIDYGDSFLAAGILLKIKEDNGYLKGYLLSFNNPDPSSEQGSEWYGLAQNKLGAIWKINYKLKDNANNQVEKSLVKAIDLPQKGRIYVKATQDSISLAGDISETIDTSGNPDCGDGFGFFTVHYSHGCDMIGHFALTNFGLTTIDLIKHNFLVDPNGGVWNGNTGVSAIQGIYKDQVQVPLPTRDGYTFVKWTQIGDSGTMSSLTDTAVYTFGENEEIDDKIVAEWIKISGSKSCNVQSGKVKVNDVVTYTITLKNEGTVDGTAVIRDDAPAGTSFVQNSIKLNGTATQNTLDNLKSGISVSVPKGGQTTLSFDVKVNDLNDDDIISNKANFRDTTVAGKETSGETNQVDVTYVEPIISVSKSATTENNQEYVTTGEKITYKITVKNEGGLEKDVVIKDAIPEGTTFVDGSIKINGTTTQYTEEDLEKGINTSVGEKTDRQSVANSTKLLDMVKLINMNVLKANSLPNETELTFEVTVNNQKDENLIKNIAQVDNTQTNEIDYTYRKPIITAEKEMETQNGLDYVVSDESIQYNIVVNNYGSISKDVVVKDLIPEGTTFVDGSLKVDDEETEYTEEDLKNGVTINVPEKQIKQEQEDTTEQPNEDVTENPNENDLENQDTNLNAEQDIIEEQNADQDTNEEQNEEQDTNEDQNADQDTDKEEDKELEDANLQDNEEPGKAILSFKVSVDELTNDSETKTIENTAQVDSKDTNKTSIDALPFNMKIEEEIPSFNVNGATQSNPDPKSVKTDIDMRKRSPVPNVTANIKISVTNTGKIPGVAYVETTLPEGFTLASSNWTAKNGNVVTTNTSTINPGDTEVLSLDAKWVNSETNMGERNSKAEIVAISNEANVGETTTEDNSSDIKMVIGLVTGEYDDEIILLSIAIFAIVSIITEIIVIKKYIL